MKFGKKLIWQILVVVVGLALVISGVIQIVGGLKSAKVSDAVNKYIEIYNLGNQIGEQMKETGNLLNGITVKEQAKDYAGALEDTSKGISDIDGVISKFNILNVKVAEFKKILGKLSDSASAVKESGLKLVNLLEKRNAASLDLVNNTKQFASLSKTYYEELAAGKTEVQIDTAQANTFIQNASQASQTLTSLTPEINAAAQEFEKAANAQAEEKQ